MRLAQLEYFAAIADAASFTVASERLLIAQPSLSQQVAALEKEVGCRLFERLPRGVRLTPAGRDFLPEARACVLAARRAKRAAQSAAQVTTGTLEIATVNSMGIGILPEAIAQWRRAHPAVATSLSFFAHHELLEAAVTSGVGDFAIGPVPARWSGEIMPVGSEEFVVVLPPGQGRNSHVIDVAELADHDWVVFGGGHGLAEWTTAACAAAGFHPRTAAEVTEVTAAVRLAAAGLGPALVPINVIPPGLDASVLRLSTPLRRDIVAYTRDQLPASAKVFVGIVGATVRIIADRLASAFGLPVVD
jgi:DNA-binding transcriptional LysR family regulator